MLEIRLLGQFNVRSEGRPVDISSQPARNLLAYLLLTRGTEQGRDLLAGVLWPESTESNARKNLRQALWRLRKAIGETNLLISSDSIGFNDTSEYWLDLDVLDVATDHDLAASVKVYEGELLPGFYEDWVVLERDRLASVFDRKMHNYLGQLLSGRAWARVIEWAEHWIAKGHYPEAAYRGLMTAYGMMGELTQVEATYQRCMDVLQTQIGVPPSEETTLLYENILTGSDFFQTREGDADRVSDRVEVLRGNLPVPPTTFIGRKQELTEIEGILQSARLLTITGPGGIGKSRLALAAAIQIAALHKDGCFFVSLAPISAAEHLIQTIAEALNFPLATHEDPGQQLYRFLRSKQMLLVMDNFEHLLEGGKYISEIMQAAPEVKILTTSREKLNLQGETIYILEGLAHHRDESLTVSEIPDAVKLFMQSAAKVQPGYAPSREEFQVIENICGSVYGMPLAIELAAAWMNVLNVDEILQELGRGLDFLEAETRDVPDRHRSIRAVFNHSWSLLSEKDQNIFMALSVFRGGFTRDAAEFVAGGTLQALSLLVNKSFVSHESESARFEIHELLRQYAHEKLEAQPELITAAEEDHAAYYGALMKAKGAELRGHGQLQALDEIEVDIENIRAAWRYYLERNDINHLWQFITSMWHFYWIRWMNHAGMEFFAHAVQVLEGVQGQDARNLTAAAKAFQGCFMGWLQLSSEGYDLAEDSIRELEQTDYSEALVLAYYSMLINAYFLGKFVEYFGAIEKMVQKADELDDPWLKAFTSFPVGMVSVMKGEHAKATQVAQQNFELYEHLGDRFGMTMQLIVLGHAAFAVEDLDVARKYYLRCLEIAEEMDFYYSIQTATKYLGKVLLSLGIVDEARAYLCKSLFIANEIGFLRDIVNLLFEFARLYTLQDQPANAVEFLSLVVSHPASQQARMFEGRIYDSAESLLEELGGKLDPEVYSTAYSRGQKLEIDTVVAGLLRGTAA